MKILGFKTGNLAINALLSAFSVAGHDSLFLESHKTVFDGFYEFKPDIVIVGGEQLTETIKEAIKRYKTKAIVVGASTNELLCYQPEPAANIAQLIGKHNKTLYSFLSYIMLEPPNVNTVSYLEHFMTPTMHVKIFGNQVPYTSYVGRVTSMRHMANILASSTFVLDYLNNFVMDAWMNNAVCIPYRSNPLIFDVDIFDRYEEPQELLDKIKKYQLDIKFRASKISDAKKYILDQHTYFHRAAELLDILEFKKESQECLSTLSELRKSLKLESS